MSASIGAVLCLALLAGCASKRGPRSVARPPPVQGSCLPVVPFTVTQELHGKSKVLFELRAADGVAVLGRPWMRVSGDVVHDLEYGADYRCEGRLVSGFGASAYFEENDSLVVALRTQGVIRFTITDDGGVLVDDPRGAAGYASDSVVEMDRFARLADSLRVRGDIRRARRAASLLIALAMLS